jgi:hypothetical protein
MSTNPFKVALLVVALSGDASLAYAQEVIANAASQVEIGGSAGRVCRIDAPTTLRAANASFAPSTVNSGQITIARVVDPITGVAQSAQISLSFEAVCNVAHAMRVRSANGGLTREEGKVEGSFASLVDYNVVARWAGQTGSQEFRGISGQILLPIEDGAAGSLELDVQTRPGTAPLATGRYSDALVVEMSAIS